jgi:hypothetical protein
MPVAPLLTVGEGGVAPGVANDRGECRVGAPGLGERRCRRGEGIGWPLNGLGGRRAGGQREGGNATHSQRSRADGVQIHGVLRKGAKRPPRAPVSAAPLRAHPSSRRECDAHRCTGAAPPGGSADDHAWPVVFPR